MNKETAEKLVEEQHLANPRVNDVDFTNFVRFNELIKDQFMYGGKKYSGDDKKEATDMLFEVHGYSWLVGTMDKYTYRYRNLKRPRDIFKIATYQYITWLKRGYYIDHNGTEAVQCTNVVTKEREFPNFTRLIEEFVSVFGSYKYDDNCIETMSNYFQKWSDKQNTFQDIAEEDLFEVYLKCYQEWNDFFSKEENQDTDTWNESKK